jgi:hypothetical protein
MPGRAKWLPPADRAVVLNNNRRYQPMDGSLVLTYTLTLTVPAPADHGLGQETLDKWLADGAEPLQKDIFNNVTLGLAQVEVVPVGVVAS